MDPNFNSINEAPVPKELSGPLPRKLRASGNGRQMAIVARIFLVLALIAVLWASVTTFQQLREREALRRGGRETTGEIARLWSPGRGTHTKVRYSFTVNGILYTGEAQVPDRYIRSLRQSSVLSTRYLAANPAVNNPSDWEWSVFQKSNSFVAAVLMLVFGIVLFMPLQGERKLSAYGAPVNGMVTNCSMRGRGGFLAKYEFRTQNGAVMRGSGWSPNSLETGASICVLYMPQNPSQNQPYPSPNYRVVPRSTDD